MREVKEEEAIFDPHVKNMLASRKYRSKKKEKEMEIESTMGKGRREREGSLISSPQSS